ncbi:hypothetical protein D3C78_1597490 [compost metagenome]
MQQLRREIRTLQDSLISKQEELAVLNRDNERLLSEARAQLQQQHQWERELAGQRQTFQEVSTTLRTEEKNLRSALADAQEEIARLQERLRKFQGEFRHYRRMTRNQEQPVPSQVSPSLPTA